MDENQLEVLWEQLKKMCQLESNEDRPYSFNGIKAISFSEDTRLLTLEAIDSCTAIYLTNHLGNTLVTALESLAGAPCFIDCAYVPQTQKANPHFTIRRTDDDIIFDTIENKPKSALELILEDISNLKRRVAELEKQSGKTNEY